MKRAAIRKPILRDRGNGRRFEQEGMMHLLIIIKHRRAGRGRGRRCLLVYRVYSDSAYFFQNKLLCRAFSCTMAPATEFVGRGYGASVETQHRRAVFRQRNLPTLVGVLPGCVPRGGLDTCALLRTVINIISHRTSVDRTIIFILPAIVEKPSTYRR